jgi:hypothetical protein
MKLHIEKAYLQPLIAEHPRLQPLAEQLRFGNKAQVVYDQLSLAELNSLTALYRQQGDELQIGRAHV